MKAKHMYFTMETVDVDDIAENQTTAGAASLSLNGADINSDGEWVSQDGMAHQIAGESSSDINTVTFTITGFLDKDRRRPATDTITGINNSAVESTVYFYIITDISSDATVGSNVHFGAVDEGVSSTIPVASTDFPLSLQVDLSGTIDYTVQYTNSDVYNLNKSIVWYDHDNLTTLTANSDAMIESPVTAVRAKVNSYSTGAELNFHIVPVRGAVK